MYIEEVKKKQVKNGCILIYDITNVWCEGEYINSEKMRYGKNKDNKRGYKQVSLGLLTTKDGCPVGVEIFPGNICEQKTVLEQIKKLKKDYGIRNAVFVGDRGILTSKRIKELTEKGYDTISALSHCEIKRLIKEKDIQPELFDENNIGEIIDTDTGIRYMLCRNNGEMIKERETRQSIINKVKLLLANKSKVRRKRNPERVAASVGKIFEKFFEWHVDERGSLTWRIKEKKIKELRLIFSS